MADYQTAIRREGALGAAIDEGLRAYMTKVYGLMAVAMVITGVVAYVVGNSPALLQMIFGTPLKWVAMLAPLGVVFLFAATVHRMSAATAQIVFWAFAALMGVSISYIFAVYTGMSIATTFFVTAIAFLSLSLYGYTTKKDLSGWGTFLIMGVIGLIVASLINIFLQSPALQFAVSALGVLIFAGLTAFDTQRLKNEYIHFAQMGQEGAAILAKGAIMGALSLYLNFLNMFMFLLQFLGAARE
ncbi:MAG: Bax inhibitor-1/YccA family protein [Pseudomonadota bacterium]